MADISTEPRSQFATEESRLIIVGTDADARVALDIANTLNVIVYGFMSDNAEDEGKDINDIPVVMRVDSVEGKKFIDAEKPDLIVTDRDIERRKDLLRKAYPRKANFVNLVYPDIVISPYSGMGVGNLIGSGCVILANSRIGSHNSIQSGVFIDTDVTIGELCTIQAGVKIGRNVTIDDEVFIGAGAILFAGAKIGKGVFIAPGAVVFHSVSDNVRVAGNPAKPTGNG